MNIIQAKGTDVDINGGKVLVNGVCHVSLSEGSLLYTGRDFYVIFPYEYHVTRKGTVIFFTASDLDLNQKTENALRDIIKRLTSLRNERHIPAGYGGTSRSSTMDAASAMMSGATRSPEEIAERQRRSGPPHFDSISDMIRFSNGDDSLSFDDDL